MAAIIRKELADHFTGIRCLILFVLAFVISALALYSAYYGIRGEGSGDFIFLRLYTTEPPGITYGFIINFINFVALFFIPLVGIVLGFDAINRERSGGTLSRIMSQPIYRDSVINSKFFAGLIILSVLLTCAVLLIAGYGLRMIGVPPGPEEIIRLFIFLVLMIVYGAFWISLSIIFSILFRNLATSMISSIALWIIFSFVFYVAARGLDNYSILPFSPNWLFSNAASAIMYPMARTMGMITEAQVEYMIANPLSLGQSMILIWPYLTGLVCLSIVCFAISYLLFMRQEIRST